MTEETEVIGCRVEGCTFVDTQVCSRTGQSEPCENAIYKSDEDEDTQDGDDASDEPSADENTASEPLGAQRAEADPSELLGLHVGQELGEEELDGLLNGALYGRVVGVLGDTAAGKTSLLISIYMMLAAGELEEIGLSFAGSLTLPGFETRCKHTRVWAKGQAPQAMTARTLVGSPRGAGFLHLDLAHRSGSHSRLLMSDLPGEWTREFIQNARFGSRLSFASRCDAILLVIDGAQLTGGDRWAVIEDQKLLIDRLAALLGQARPPLAIVATRRDVIGAATPAALTTVINHANGRGFEASPFVVCTFSSDAAIHSGEGMKDVIEFCLAPSGRLTETSIGPASAGRMFGWEPVMHGRGPL